MTAAIVSTVVGLVVVILLALALYWLTGRARPAPYVVAVKHRPTGATVELLHCRSRGVALARYGRLTRKYDPLQYVVRFAQNSGQALPTGGER